MLIITDSARANLAQMLEQQGAAPETAVRFVSDGQGIALQPDSEREGDTAFKHEGRTILLLDSQMSDLLSGVTLDFADEKYTLHHPNEGE